MKLVIKNGHIISPLEDRFADITVEAGLIAAIGDGTEQDAAADGHSIDARGCWVTPGLIDLQVNGGSQCDFWGDPTPEEVMSFATELARAGVTTILPTLITDDLTHLRKNIDYLEKELGVGPQQLTMSGPASAPAKAAIGSAKQIAAGTISVRMPGIHLEGPCLSPERPGVHPPEHLQPLTLSVLEKIITPSVKLITLAPELDPEGTTLTWLLKQGVEVALGHSNATYEQAQQAFGRGVKLMTHTYNALPPIHHRAPGAVTAALLEPQVTCCIICDGQHVSAPAVQLALKAKGIGGSILVTDVAHVGTSQGGLVGSSILLDTAVRNVVKWGIATFREAIMMATLNPARALGWDSSIGMLAPGRQADIVVWDKQTLAVKHVIVRGSAIL
jgi:N-acetylglucosamine-6-phosphate deacetylase